MPRPRGMCDASHERRGGAAAGAGRPRRGSDREHSPRRKILVRKTKRSKGSVVGEGSLDGRSADGESTRHPTPQQRIDFGLVGALETAAPLVRPNPRPPRRAPRPSPPPKPRLRHADRDPEGAAGARNGPCSATSVRRAPPAIRWFSPLLTRRTDPWRAGENEIVDRPAATARDPDRAIARSPARRARSRLPSPEPRPRAVPQPSTRRRSARRSRRRRRNSPPRPNICPRFRIISCARKRASRTAPSTTIIPARIANSPRRAKSTPPSPRRSARRAGRNARTRRRR